ncbi:PepSY-associated TM helix domain-containing protein [Permianibacter aggregans]|uniref:Putative iron-regulated membrane protein n=1 Tax=Permianibacter aggregans TaxID=1510150 RepID=A0A4R6UPK2_9GAMM|nr:PepSY-associated TM helix domain-containing protein [Permianibacter aggregans]QGX41052.1 hypothetical protein E2H98_15815 [Permianibacter aggregans]TDQ48116.1 putative iron-regulated membrane protein [Permianibacter aggregans]
MSQSLRTINSSHIAFGVACGLLLFAISWFGLLSLFRSELMIWQHPAIQLDEQNLQPLSPDVLIQRAREQGFLFNEFRLELARGEDRFAQILAQDENKRLHERFLDVHTGKILQAPEQSIADYFWQWHTDLLLPKPWGRYLVGLLGVALFYLLIVGIFGQRKFGRSYLTWRRDKSKRLWFSDGHRFFGAWLAPFQLLMGFSGALLGLAGLLLGLIALVAFDGDRHKATAALFGEEPVLQQQKAPMAPLAPMFEQFEQIWPGSKIERVEYHGYGDAGGQVHIRGTWLARWAAMQEMHFDAVTGEHLRQTDFTELGSGGYLYSLAVTLHLVRFYQPIVKIFYALLTFGLLALMLFGVLLALDKRRSGEFSWHWLRCSYWLCLAMPSASAVLLLDAQLAQLWARAVSAPGPLFWLSLSFAILALMWTRSHRQALQRAAGMLAILLAASAALSLSQGVADPIVLAVDIGLLLLALFSAGIYWRMRRVLATTPSPSFLSLISLPAFFTKPKTQQKEIP